MNIPTQPCPKPGCTCLLALAGTLLGAGPALADNSLGPNPYGPGFGFDAPQEASWGGWQRTAPGTVHAEWDVFNDASHGKGDDRTAAPDLGRHGTTSAWLGWNAGTFVSSTQNLYSFSVPETVRINLAAPPGAGRTRVALQLEAQGEGRLDPRYLRLNGRGASRILQTYRGTYASSMGPADLVHQVALWDFDQAPDSFAIEFTLKQHTTIRQIAVDIGPHAGGEPVTPEAPEPLARVKTWINLPAEDLGAERTTRLYAQNRRYFPQIWRDRQLAYQQSPRQAGQQAKRQLTGKIKALFYDEAAADGVNTLFVDLYRPDGNGDLKLAECRLKPTQIRRWAKVILDDRSQRLGTAVYALDVRSTEFAGEPARTRLTRQVGQCDIDLATAGLQPGVPNLREGDYSVLRRGQPETPVTANP